MKIKDLNRFRKILLQKRSELIIRAIQARKVELGLSVDDLFDETDAATCEYLQSMFLQLLDREHDSLLRIKLALHRIEDGTFGTCLRCGNTIPVSRLTARPEAVLCLTCQEAREQREKGHRKDD